MDTYVELYLQQLTTSLKEKGIDLPKALLSPSHFDLVWLDYSRVVMTGLWKRLSPQQILKYANAVGPSMITKSLEHARFIVQRVHRLLREEEIVQKQLAG